MINFSKAIYFDNNLFDSYFGRAKIYDKQKLYQESVADYSTCILLYESKKTQSHDINKQQMYNSILASLYYFRGLIREKMDEHFLAINDQSIAISLMGSSYGEAYIARGMAKYYEALDYCQDFKIACEESKLCDKWNYYCK